jgi:hypothetical protein
VFKIFLGALKYDMNDTMLAGQNEAAEKFYRKSLSMLHSVSQSLRDGKSIQVANYYIGVAFFEIFSSMQSIKIIDNDEILISINDSNILIRNPSMNQKKADEISLKLIRKWVNYCKKDLSGEGIKSLKAINDELWCLSNNNEEQELVDNRLGVIFEEIAGLLESYGDSLYRLKENKTL